VYGKKEDRMIRWDDAAEGNEGPDVFFFSGMIRHKVYHSITRKTHLHQPERWLGPPHQTLLLTLCDNIHFLYENKTLWPTFIPLVGSWCGSVPGPLQASESTPLSRFGGRSRGYVMEWELHLIFRLHENLADSYTIPTKKVDVSDVFSNLCCL
jgi:hypothetical protein